MWLEARRHERNLLAHLRADLFNSNGAQRTDGQQWAAEHFGGDPAPKKDPRVKWDREALKTRIKTVFGEDGRAFVKPKKGEKKVSIISTLKGQPLPPRKAG